MFVITVYALVSCALTPSEEMPASLPKPIWILIILLFTPLGGIAWLIIRFINRYDGAQVSGFGGKKKKEEFVAPDDNEEFLFKLDRDMQLRREGKERDEQDVNKNLYGNKNSNQESNMSNDSDYLSKPSDDFEEEDSEDFEENDKTDS